MPKLTILVLAMAMITVGTGCTSTSSKKRDSKYAAGDRESRTRGNATKLYNEAQKELQVGNWTAAIESLDEIQTRYPFSDEARQAQLEIIYAYYRSTLYEQAIAATQRFIRRQPRHPNVDYVYYLRGVLQFHQAVNEVDGFLGIDGSKRDQSFARRAFQNFKLLLRRFPNSRYAADARQRMVFLRERMAKHEVYVASFYHDRGAYVAAVTRAKYVVEHFQGTSAVGDALDVMVRSYRRMGVPKLADDARRILAASFPNYRVDGQDGLPQPAPAVKPTLEKYN